MNLSPSVRMHIEQVLRSHDTVLFMKGTRSQPRCGFSAAVVDTLTQLGVQYHDVDVLQDPDLREGIKAFGQWPTIPQLYHQGELIGGCDIVRELAQRGELAGTLGVPAAASTGERVQQMTVQALHQHLQNKTPLKLYDVRTEAERRLAQLPGAVPWDAAAQMAMDLLPKDTQLVFHCHHGGRSQAAAERAVQKGFRNVWNVQGGIDAWSQVIDPTVPRY